MSLSLAVFLTATLATLAGALGVVLARNIVYAAFALLLSLIGVAGIFLTAFAEFLALVQILICGGAIVIVILFTLILTHPTDFGTLTDNRQWPLAALVAVCIFAVMALAILTTEIRTVDTQQTVPFSELATALFKEWAIPLEITSLILLVALIGSIVMVGSSKGRE